jgi:hypothetical protein
MNIHSYNYDEYPEHEKAMYWKEAQLICERQKGKSCEKLYAYQLDLLSWYCLHTLDTMNSAGGYPESRDEHKDYFELNIMFHQIQGEISRRLLDHYSSELKNLQSEVN